MLNDIRTTLTKLSDSDEEERRSDLDGSESRSQMTASRRSARRSNDRQRFVIT